MLTMCAAAALTGITTWAMPFAPTRAAPALVGVPRVTRSVSAASAVPSGRISRVMRPVDALAAMRSIPMQGALAARGVVSV